MTPPAVSTSGIPELDSPRIQLDAEHFYWAKLDASALGGGRRSSSRALGYLFESVLPIPLDEMQAVYVRADAQSYIACGMEKARLEEHAAFRPITLTPKQLPEFLNSTRGIEASRFNLLTGDYVPSKVLRLRRRWLAAAAMIVLLFAAGMTFGFERRIVFLNHQTDSCRQNQNRLATEVLGDAVSQSPLPPALQLTAELRELQSTRQVDTTSFQQIDASQTLAGLLELWPQDLQVRTTSVSITDRTIVIQAELPESSGAQQLAEALEAMPDWTLRQPRVDTFDDAVRTMIQLAKQEDTNSQEAR